MRHSHYYGTPNVRDSGGRFGTTVDTLREAGRLEGDRVGVLVTPSQSSENHTGSACADERSRGIGQLIR
jgi:hypothetical protein